MAAALDIIKKHLNPSCCGRKKDCTLKKGAVLTVALLTNFLGVEPKRKNILFSSIF